MSTIRVGLGAYLPFGLGGFLLVGIANTLVGLSTIFIVKWGFGAGDVLANACGYLVGLSVSFTLNRRWTFRHKGAVLPAAARFLVAFAIAYSVNLATVLLLIHQFGINGYLAQFLGIPPYTALFYLISRYFAFRAPR
jgi:putative flippase GtrA